MSIKDTEAYKEGLKAWDELRLDAVNPYPINTYAAEMWYLGWHTALEADLYKTRQ